MRPAYPGEVRIIYSYLLSSIEKEYITLKTLKNSERGCVSLLQNRQNGTRLIFRHYRGNGEVYRKLLHVSCPNLPQIMEAAESGGMVAVLEEYIQGDSLAFLLAGGAVYTGGSPPHHLAAMQRPVGAPFPGRGTPGYQA